MSNICKTASFRTENWRFWSEWRDSNSRHPGPKPGALPTGPHPDIELREKARCGQICGQGNSTTFLANIQRRYLRGFTEKEGSMQHFRASNRFGVPAPKAGALPTALHLDRFDLRIIHDKNGKCNHKNAVGGNFKVPVILNRQIPIYRRRVAADNACARYL